MADIADTTIGTVVDTTTTKDGLHDAEALTSSSDMTSKDLKTAGPPPGSLGKTEYLKNPMKKMHYGIDNRRRIVERCCVGDVYGNPSLINCRYEKTTVSHDKYAKLVEKYGEEMRTPGFKFFNTFAFYIPNELFVPNSIVVTVMEKFVNPKTKREEEVEKEIRTASDKVFPGNGDSGVLEYHWSGFNTDPGCDILMAAAEDLVRRLIAEIVKSMRMQHSMTKSAVRHELSLQTISTYAGAAETPFTHYVAAFFKEWSQDIKITHSTMKKKAKDGTVSDSISSFYHPLPISFPNPEASLRGDDRDIIDGIIKNYAETMAERGRNLFNKMEEEGRSIRGRAKNENKDKDKDKGQKPKSVKVKSDYEIALEQMRKDQKGDPKEKPSVTEKGFDIEPYLSHGQLTAKALSRIPGYDQIVGGVRQECKRFFDDFFNRVLVTLTQSAIEFCAVYKSKTITADIAFCSVRAFFIAVFMNNASEVEKEVMAHCNKVYGVYTAHQRKKSDKVRKAKEAREYRIDAMEGEGEDGGKGESEDVAAPNGGLEGDA